MRDEAWWALAFVCLIVALVFITLIVIDALSQ